MATAPVASLGRLRRRLVPRGRLHSIQHADGGARDAERPLTVAELPHRAGLGGQCAPHDVVVLEGHRLAARANRRLDPAGEVAGAGERLRQANLGARRLLAQATRGERVDRLAVGRRRVEEPVLRRLREGEPGDRPRRALAIVGRRADGAAAFVQVLGAIEPRRDELGDGHRLQDPADVRQVANRLEVAAALFVAGPRGIEVGEPEVDVADALRDRREPAADSGHALVGADGCRTRRAPPRSRPAP